jgi:hypothetical protein
MGYWITPDGSYYEGENVASGSVEVPQRPSDIHSWNNGWAVDPVLEAKKLRIASDLAEQIEGVNDGAIIALLNQTRAQWITWVGSNLTFIVLPAERNRMGTLFWLVALCARKILR